MTVNTNAIEYAKGLIGQRAWLTGGGMPLNQVMLVTVKDVRNDGHAILDTGEWHDGQFEPLLLSWRLLSISAELLPQLAETPNGDYTIPFRQEAKYIRLVNSSRSYSIRLTL